MPDQSVESLTQALESIAFWLEIMEKHLLHLRKAVQEGVYDSREVAGDVNLRLEGDIREMRATLELYGVHLAPSELPKY